MRKIFFWFTSLLALSLLTGCEAIKITNLTPTSYPENPSRIYTITLRVDLNDKDIVQGSVEPYIIIDGQNHLMKKSATGPSLYEYDYRLPNGRSALAYYFIVKYEIAFIERNEPREVYSELTRVDIASRYVLALETNRGPVGARISLLGRGFTPQDTIYFDSQPIRTQYDSSTSLSFFVPPFASGRNYTVTLGSASGQTSVGTFRIDSSSLSVAPQSLILRTGETQSLTFTIATPAPAGGLLLDVTTDVPESVIMPEVVVPAGQTTVTVTVQGGYPGSGNLYLKGYGAGEVTVPVSVSN